MMDFLHLRKMWSILKKMSNKVVKYMQFRRKVWVGMKIWVMCTFGYFCKDLGINEILYKQRGDSKGQGRISGILT